VVADVGNNGEEVDPFRGERERFEMGGKEGDVIRGIDLEAKLL
jgi:hypothetical protein